METIAVMMLFCVGVFFLWWVCDRSFDKSSAKISLNHARAEFVILGGERELQFLRIAEVEYKKLGGVFEPWPLQKWETNHDSE